MMAFLRRELVWMVLSLLLATALWAVVTNQQNPPSTDYFQSIQVTVRGAPAGLVVLDPIKSVRIKVTAPRDVWQRLTSANFNAYVDASKAGPGVQDAPIHVESNDSRVRIDEVQPSVASLRLEEVASKDVPVGINLTGSLPLGYTSKPASVTPQQVTITGPQSQVNAASQVMVNVPLDGLQATINQPFKPVVQSADGEDLVGVTVKPGSVFVEVPVEREVSYKTVPIAPQVSGVVSSGYQIVGLIADPTAVTIVGDPNVLADISYLPTKPVNVANIMSDLNATVDPALPDGVALARKQSITVRVYTSTVDGSQSFRVAPSAKVGNGRQPPTVTPGGIDVVLSGPMPLLTSIKPQDIKISVDTSSLASGTYTVTPTITVPVGLRVDSVSPDKLSVVVP